MSNSRSFLLLVSCMLVAHALFAQSSRKDFQMERLINHLLVDYPLSQENMFRLATYAELKGRYSNEHQALSLDFADLGTLVIYSRTCVLKTSDRRLYYLNKGHNLPSHVDVFNQRVNEMLNRIFLFANHDQAKSKISFVDSYLAKKNIEPYEKIFLRHILLKYGRYDQRLERVEFHTDWLPDQSYTKKSQLDRSVVRKPINPMWIKLDKTILRGYFIRSGGTVYVEDVERDVVYATGEDYAYNVAAFKTFLYKMLTQTTQYIVGLEKSRLDGDEKQELYASAPVPGYGRSRGASNELQITDLNKPSLYKKNDWIPMMLGILRSQNVNVGDADIIQYFVNEPYFDEIYKQLLPHERRKVDEFLRRK